MVRHLFFNGFHPVFPWTAFLFVGMWLGRRNVLDPAIRKGIFLFATAIAVLTEATSWLLARYFSTHPHDIDAETVTALFGTAPMPPMPLYMLAGGSAAVAVIVLSVAVVERFPKARWYAPLLATGQLALTLYVAHVIIGMGNFTRTWASGRSNPTFCPWQCAHFLWVCRSIFLFVEETIQSRPA